MELFVIFNTIFYMYMSNSMLQYLILLFLNIHIPDSVNSVIYKMTLVDDIWKQIKINRIVNVASETHRNVLLSHVPGARSQH